MPSYDYMSSFSQPCLNPKSYRDLPSPAKPGGILISVSVDTWNREKWVITGAVDSIFEENRNFPTGNYEVILVDDATEGPRRQDLLESVDHVLREYPNHNFRAYLLMHTRTWLDTHTCNTAWRRSLGRIILMSQADIIHKGETLESAWRHHNTGHVLRVIPQHHIRYKDGTLSDEWMHGEPHEFGASYPAWCIQKIKGKDERCIAHEDHIEFQDALKKACGVVTIKDPSVFTYHRQGSHPPYDGPWWDGQKLVDQEPPPDSPKKRLRKGAPNFIGGLGRRPDYAWTSGDWGTLTPEEEKNVIMTEAMRKTLKGG